MVSLVMPAVWIIKIDSKGNKEWDKTFGGWNFDVGFSIQQTSDDGYVIVGETASYGTGSYDVWLIKTDPNGNEEWNKTFGGTDSDFGESVQQTSDGGYAIVGWTESYGAGDYDVWLIKTDPKGNEEWNKTFGRTRYERGDSVQQTSDNGYVIVGRTESYGAGIRDVWILKTDPNGNEEWNKTFGGTSCERGNSVQQTSDDGYIIAGKTRSCGSGNSDVWLIKVRGEIPPTPTTSPEIPGFRAVSSLFWLLTVAYLLRRRK